MIPVSLTTLINEVRTRGEFRAPYYTDAEITSYLNASLASLRNIITQIEPFYYMHYQDISTVVGQPTYQVTDNGMMVDRVLISDSSATDGWRTLDTYNIHDVGNEASSTDYRDWRWQFPGPRESDITQPSGSSLPKYSNSTIVIYPVPQEIKTIRVYYVEHMLLGDGTIQGNAVFGGPDCANWTTSTCYFDFMGESEYVILKALIYAGAKDEMSAVPTWKYLLDDKRKEIIATVRATASMPDKVSGGVYLGSYFGQLGIRRR